MLAMADTAKQPHYAGETRPIEIKQSSWEGSVAHPERDGAKSETEGATERWVDVYSNHGGANDGDGDAPATAVEKRTNQPVIKYHGHKAKLTACSARTEAHHSTLATATRTPRGCCQSRRRRAASGVPR